MFLKRDVAKAIIAVVVIAAAFGGLAELKQEYDAKVGRLVAAEERARAAEAAGKVLRARLDSARIAHALAKVEVDSIAEAEDSALAKYHRLRASIVRPVAADTPRGPSGKLALPPNHPAIGDSVTVPWSFVLAADSLATMASALRVAMHAERREAERRFAAYENAVAFRDQQLADVNLLLKNSKPGKVSKVIDLTSKGLATVKLVELVVTAFK